MGKFNNIFFYFFSSQLLIFPAYFYHTPLISSDIQLNKAIWIHFIGICFSAVGYFTAKYIYVLREQTLPELFPEKDHYFQNSFYVFSYFFVLVGTIINMLQVFLFVSPMDYISKIFSAEFDADIRIAYLLSSEAGGMPGIIKMFSYAPLSIYLMSFGLSTFLKLDDVDIQKLKVLRGVSLVAIIIKVFFSLDRLTIMAVILANIFFGLKEGYLKKMRFWFFLICSFLLADYLSSKRWEDFGIIDFVLLYFKLGLVNLQLMIESVNEYTYGFSTILGPLLFVLKFLNLSPPNFEYSYEWEWNPAQYFTSYAFEDFGYFYFLLFYLVGVLLHPLDVKIQQKNIYVSAIYFVVL